MPAVACPGCNRRYRIPPEAAGRKVRCKHCHKVFAIATAEEEELYDLAPDPDPPPPPPPPAAKAAADAPKGPANPDTFFDRDPGPPSRGLPGLLADTGHAFLFPTRVSSLISFIFVGLLLTVGAIVQYAGCIGAMAGLVILGWYAAYQLQVVQEATAGERDLPDLNPEAGFHGLILPLLKFLAVQFVSHLPFFVVCTVLASTGAITIQEILDFIYAIAQADYATAFAGMSAAQQAALAALISTLLFATLLQPLLFLCVAVGGIPELVRLDLMVLTIVRTPAAYGLVLLVFTALSWAPVVIGLLTAPETGGLWSGAQLLHELVLAWVEGYCTLVAMPVVGLYYHHLKDRFAWTWG